MTRGAEETIAPSESTAVATSVMVLPATAPELAETMKVPPTVFREPEIVAGAPTLPGPEAARVSCVMFRPPEFHPLATAVSDPPGCSVAPAEGAVMATRVAVMMIAEDETAAALSAVPELPSLPDAPLVAVKLPGDTGEKGTCNTALAPLAMVAAVADPDCCAVALPETEEGCT